MGMFVINCPTCGGAHYWFSGNLDQRCAKCRAPLLRRPYVDALDIRSSKAWEGSRATSTGVT